MATGTQTYNGLGLPAYGQFTITQTVGATDIVTIEGGNGQTGDFLVARTSTEVERFVVQDGGNVVITQGLAADIGLAIARASTPPHTPSR